MREGEAPRIGPAALGRHRHLINILPSGQLNGTLPQRRLISQLRPGLAWLGCLARIDAKAACCQFMRSMAESSPLYAGQLKFMMQSGYNLRVLFTYAPRAQQWGDGDSVFSSL